MRPSCRATTLSSNASFVMIRGLRDLVRLVLVRAPVEVRRMTHKTIVVFAVLALAACSRDHSDRAGTTTTTGAGMDRPATVEEVRMVMLTERPDSIATINALRITNENGVVTLRGHVDDDQTKKVLVDRVKKMQGVREVNDELTVVPRQMEGSGSDKTGSQPY